MRTSRSSRALLAAFAALGGFLSFANAQSVATTPVGAVTIPAIANSETYFSVPLARAASFKGEVASVSSGVLSVDGNPGWAADQFVKSLPSQPDTYYVRFKSGSLAGQYFTVTDNAASTLTLDNGGLDLSAVVAGDTFELVPYWSLGSLFPASAAGSSFIASASAFSRQTEIYFANYNYNGINPPTDETFYFTNSAWRKVGANAADSYNDKVVPPDVFVKIRNRAAGTAVTVVGQVNDGAIGTVINKGAVKLDNLVSISFPADVSLGDSGLVSSGAFQASASAFVRADELLVYSDDTAGLNRPSVATYYYLNSAWRKVGSNATTDFSADKVFKAAKGVVIRKAAGTPSSSLWTYTASISQ